MKICQLMKQIKQCQKSNITGNIKANIAALGGKMNGNINSNQIKIKKTANIEGNGKEEAGGYGKIQKPIY